MEESDTLEILRIRAGERFGPSRAEQLDSVLFQAIDDSPRLVWPQDRIVGVWFVVENNRDVAIVLIDEDQRNELPLLVDFLGVPDPERPAPALSPELRKKHQLVMTL